MKITEEQRKLLTEWLGECFRENCMGCPKEKEKYNCPSHYIDRRTFDNWTDFGVVVEKLNKKTTDAYYFSRFLGEAYENDVLDHEDTPIYEMWLLDPERFCILVAEAIKEGVIKQPKGEKDVHC